MYEIVNSNKLETESIKKFISSIEDKFFKIKYLDIVSLERSLTKPYIVKWIGPNDDFLVNYHSLITSYFKRKDAISLLLLSGKSKSKTNWSRHDLFKLNNSSKVIHNLINPHHHLYDKFLLDNTSKIIIDENLHKTKWANSILEQLEIDYATFSKIEFSIKDKKFIAAIWIGWLDVNNEHKGFVFHKTKIENFLWSYSSGSIASELLADIQNHSLQSAISRIINRNYAHHIGSHVSMRSTLDKIIERQTGKKPADTTSSLLSFVEMENLLTRYKDERNDFIAGIDNNNQPITLSFYSDIIRPFIENSLIMDNIAKSEGISWESEKPNESNGKVKDNGISKLRIQVFYHKDISGKNKGITTCSSQDIANMNCSGHCKNQHHDESLTLKDLKIDNSEWNEMVAHYSNVLNENNNLCIHQLPYLKTIKERENQFYERIDYTLDDFEIAIPGALGVHCIYSILENHIRNTAKHADRTFLSKSSHMDIIIKISKENEDYYNFELTSNIPTIRAKDYESVLEDIRINKLKEPINSEAKSLGFADMRINSTLLAFEKITQENLDKNITVGVYPQNIKTENKENPFKYSLKFDFRITKPFKIVFIGSLVNVNDSNLHDKGYISYRNIKEAINGLIKNPRSFQFAVIDSNIFNADKSENAEKDIENIDYNLLLKYLPWRVLAINTNIGNNRDLRKLINNRRITCVDDFDFHSINEPEWLETCWKKWISIRWNKECDLSIYFQEENSEGATKRYLEALNNANTFYKTNIIAKSDNINRNQNYDKTKTYIFYDRHGKRGFDSFETNCDENNYNPLNVLKNFSWIYLDKNNPDFDRIYLDKLKAPLCSLSKLIESGLHRILVIDERAREYALSKSNHTSTPRVSTNKDMIFLEEALLARIYIADSCILNKTEILFKSKIQPDNCSFMQIVLSEEIFKFNSILFPENQYNNNGLCPNNNPFDTLIIHRTILNKIFDDKENGGKIFSMLSDKFPNILVTTGGGTLPYNKDVMNRIKTVPFFSIKKSILNGCIAKNSLTNII